VVRKGGLPPLFFTEEITSQKEDSDLRFEMALPLCPLR
jgi:hypothetical protein